MNRVSFNLIDEPWIAVRDDRNRVVELSLGEVFSRAHALVGLAGEVPTQNVAILRLLLAILRRSFPTARTEADWAELWGPGRFAEEPVRDYLEEHRERFDLLHPETPFYQVADLRTAKGEMTQLSRLIPDVPAGHPYFTTRAGSALREMPFGEAARWLVHSQAFDPSGIKSGAVGDDRVSGGRGYPIGIAWCGWLGVVVVEGESLFHTLLLNLPLGRSLPRGEADRPVWERLAQGAGVEERPGAPHGPTDLLTWQSRRIRLGHDGQKVTGVLIANGDPLHPRDMFRHEFMTGWRLSEAQMKAQKSADPIFMPRAHAPDRAVWRGLAALLTSTNRDANARAGRWLEWLVDLSAAGILPSALPFRLHTTGMQYGSQSAVIDDITDDVLPLHMAVLADRQLKELALCAVADVDGAVRALARLASDLVRAAGGDSDLARTASNESREQGYAALDAPYRRWVAGLMPGAERDLERLRWQQEVRASVSALGRQLLDSATTAAWSGRPVEGEGKQPLNAATAANWFYINLRGALSMAYDTPEGEAS